MSEAPDRVTVAELLGPELADLRLSPLCGEENRDNEITNPRVQKPGLAFAGFYRYIKPGRVQIIGESEVNFIATIDEETRAERFDAITRMPIPVIIITKGLEPDPLLVDLCGRRGLPVLSSLSLSSTVIKRVSNYLEDHLVPSTHLHGVLLEIYGLGVLLIGESGVGKSECALDLITRGHSLVADDRVTVKRYPNGDMVGSAEGAHRHHMELRGLGIVNVQDLFGLASVRERKTIDLVIQLERWDESKAYDRLGLDETVYTILDSPCPFMTMPVALGRNMSILVEIAARNHMLKLKGHHSAREFARRLEHDIEKQRQGRAAGPPPAPRNPASG